MARTISAFKIRSGRMVRLSLAAALAASLIGCASNEELKRNQTAIEQARQELAEAEHQRQLALAEADRLRGQIADQEKLLASLQGGGADRDRLLAQLAKLQNDYNELLKMQNSGPALPEVVNSLLRDLVAQYPTLLEFDEKLGMVRLKSDLTFALGSTEVTPRAKAALAAFAHILNNDKIARNEIQVVGHTDDVPISPGGPTAARNPNNWVLSTNRAWAVADVLHDNGVDKSRVMAGGWGDQRPIVANAVNFRGAEQNRRVDIYIRPTTVPDNLVVSTGVLTTRPARTPTTRASTTRPAAPATRGGTPPAGRPASPVVPVPIPG